VAALLVCDLGIPPFGKICLVLLPSCSLLTHGAKTQWVIRRGSESSGFLIDSALTCLFGRNTLTSDVSRGFRGKYRRSVLSVQCNVQRKTLELKRDRRPVASSSRQCDTRHMPRRGQERRRMPTARVGRKRCSSPRARAGRRNAASMSRLAASSPASAAAGVRNRHWRRSKPPWSANGNQQVSKSCSPPA